MEVLIILLFAGYVDYKKRIIPNEVILVIYLCAIFFSDVHVLERVTGFFIPALPLLFLALKIKSLKGGDIKYLSAVGSYFGLTNLAGIMFFTTVLALLWSALKNKKSIPLALFMAWGYILLLIYKECIT